MTVVPLERRICDKFVALKHYSHQLPIFWEGFGLVEDGHVVGVCVFGQPSPAIQKHAFYERDFRLCELTRVVIQTRTRNAASVLISSALKRLEKPSAVVSYADMEHSHCGIIYQATNWLYTGATVSHDHTYLVDQKRGFTSGTDRVHSMTLRDAGITNPKEWARANGIESVEPAHKHRYFFLNGNRKEKRRMLDKLQYPVIRVYPKCVPDRYDDGAPLIVEAPKIATQEWFKL